jgi:hypothetical protein
MTNENIPDPIFPSEFPVEPIITTILDNLTPEMVELIKNRDKCVVDIHDKNIELKKEQMKHAADAENNAETTKRLGMGLALGLFVSILIYSVVSGDKALTEKVVIGSISAVAGAGGVLINQQKDKS